MLNRTMRFQTLVMILALASSLAAPPAAADPPAAWAERAERFSDWRLDCRRDPCTPWTAVRGADGSQVLRLAAEPGDAPSLVLTTPLPLLLPDGLALAVGAEPERVVPWRTCGAGGCEARLSLDGPLLATLRRERGGSATFTLVDGMKVRLPFSLLGFTAASRAASP
ncbi:MAG TPA: invasion associated locus B family protein [Amaricoccus sp.]|nr:invasion associated locus B family protein [Amaricoccus sp.]